MDRKELLWLWLHHAAGAYVIAFEQVLSKYPDIEEVFELAAKRSAAAFSRWGQTFRDRLFDTANDAFLETQSEWLRTHGVVAVPLFSPVYPPLLKEITHPPSMLFVKGTLPQELKLPIAIVGMRRSTAYGEAVATHFAEELVRNGATIISGMAAGIDSCAAEGALRIESAQCPTIAVLGCGVDVVYPETNAPLYARIAERGAVVSEFLPGTRPYRDNFPIRNRIISGLSRGVVIVEASSRSGTTITANYALEQNRDVFAVPGRITDASSVGPNGLIQRGEARPVFCAGDILAEYGLQATSAGITREAPDTSMLSPAEKRIVEQLMAGEKSADELCELLSLGIAQVNSSLTSLLFSGIIKQLPGRVFSL